MRQTTISTLLASCGDCLWRGLGCAWFWGLQQRRPARPVPPPSFAPWFPGPAGPGAGALGHVEGQVLSGVCHTPHGLLLPKHSVPSTPGHAPQTSPALPALKPVPKALTSHPGLFPECSLGLGVRQESAVSGPGCGGRLADVCTGLRDQPGVLVRTVFPQHPQTLPGFESCLADLLFLLQIGLAHPRGRVRRKRLRGQLG